MDFLKSWDATNLRADWSLPGPDLATDQGLQSAVIDSLFTDRLAAPDDELPSGDGDRRGWWGDLPLADAPDSTVPDLIGSRLWLLKRAKQTNDTLARAVAYCREALQWMIDDGVAASIDVQAQFQGLGFMAIAVTIARIKPDGGTVDHRFDLQWNATLSE